MATINVGVRSDNKLTITKLTFINNNLTVLHFQTESINHAINFLVLKGFMKVNLQYIQYLTTKLENSLLSSISCFLGRSSSGFSLYDKDFTLRTIVRASIGESAREICSLCLLLLTDSFLSFLCLFSCGSSQKSLINDCFGIILISAKPSFNFLGNQSLNNSSCLTTGKNILGLTRENRVRHNKGKNQNQTFLQLFTSKVSILFFQELIITSILIYSLCESSSKTS